MAADRKKRELWELECASKKRAASIEGAIA
jgi:hypothetical protein